MVLVEVTFLALHVSVDVHRTGKSKNSPSRTYLNRPKNVKFSLDSRLPHPDRNRPTSKGNFSKQSMLGFCIRGEATTKNVSDHGVVMVTELGLRVTPYRLREMLWPSRLQVAVDIINLMDYLHRSPLGSLRMSDFKQSQFIFVNGQIKLSDLDDITSDERGCQRDRDCYILDESANIPCKNGVCSGINSKSNLLLATVELLQPLLTESPSFLNQLTAKLLQDLSYKRLSTEQAKNSIENVVELWLEKSDTPLV
ncbi:putative extracellular tyrosine-protein kinase PKDCC [Apostichopus japonicus]|uniref:Putative extracellular tyrosine-protein kinase PKDCC n=1 Tax=Stichopus japonicus TaxID=307972 RepID=A0A2G8LQM0_STIJA|nr:putative extracellular tyrosine-protein kinase PKDCC [Apostichopus japonicus]